MSDYDVLCGNVNDRSVRAIAVDLALQPRATAMVNCEFWLDSWEGYDGFLVGLIEKHVRIAGIEALPGFVPPSCGGREQVQS